MSVKARLYVSSIQRFAYNPGQVRVDLSAVSRGEHNKNWATATPSATFTMTIQNPAASQWFIDLFEAKQEIEVTFDPAPVEDPS